MVNKAKILQLAFDAKLREWAKEHKKIAKEILKGYSPYESQWKKVARLSKELEEIALMGDITKKKNKRSQERITKAPRGSGFK